MSCTASLFCGLPLYFGYLVYCTMYSILQKSTVQVANFKSVLWTPIGYRFLVWSDPGSGSETGCDFFWQNNSFFIIFDSKVVKIVLLRLYLYTVCTLTFWGFVWGSATNPEWVSIRIWNNLIQIHNTVENVQQQLCKTVAASWILTLQ